MKQIDKRLDGKVALRCAVLTAPDVLPEAIMRKKARELAELEEAIINLVAGLPDRLHLRDVFVSSNDKKISIYFDMPLFYKENIDVLFYYVRPANTAYWQTRELGKAVNINNGFSLMLNIFSDLETKDVYERFVQAHPKQHFYSAIETTYFFDKQGQGAKTVRLPEEIRIDRKQLLEHEPVYHSAMTAEDFVYAERALTVIKDRIEDYLKWSKQPQSITI
jgi:hypothetical protein